MAERSPLHGRSIVEVLATSAGGVGTHVRSIVPAVRAAGATVRVCGAPATEELFGFRAAGADFVPVGISTGLAPSRTAAPSSSCAGPLAGADLVHAHGLRAGLVAAAARRLSGERTRPLVLTLHNAILENAGPLQRVLRAAERTTIRAADLVLAVSSDLAANARQAGARDVRVVPAMAPPRPPATRTRAEVREELGLDDGPAAGARRRPAAPAEGLRRPARRRGPLGGRRPAGSRAAGRDRRRRAARGRADRAHPRRAAARAAARPP